MVTFDNNLMKNIELYDECKSKTLENMTEIRLAIFCTEKRVIFQPIK